VDTAYTYVNNTTVQLATAPGAGVRVEVRRVTPATSPLVDFADGSTLVAADLDTANLQHLYLEQELDDYSKQTISIDPATGLLTASGQRITNVGTPVNDADAVTKDYVDSRYGELGVPGLTRWRKIATAGQTVFSGLGTDGGTLAYSASRESVFINGAFQQRGVDYTADNGTSITVTPALLVGDVVEVHCVNNVAGGITDQASGLYFTQSGTGAAVRTVDSKLKESVSVKDFGAVGNGVTDDTAAIQAAVTAIAATGGTIYFPVGTYKITDVITVNTGVYTTGILLKGAGNKSIISQTGAAKDAIKFSSTQVLNNSGLEDLGIVCSATAGNCITIGFGCTNCRFINLVLTALNTAKSCIYGDFTTVGDGVYDTKFSGGIYYLNASGAAANGVKLVSAGTTINENIFENLRVYQSGTQPFFSITTTGLAQYLVNNRFNNINFEICAGGGIYLTNARGNTLSNLSFWDCPTYNGHLIEFGSNSGYESIANTLINIQRHGDALASGKRDIKLTAGQDIVMINCWNQTTDNPSYDFNSKRVTVIGRMAANVLNATNSIFLLPDGVIFRDSSTTNAYVDTLHLGALNYATSASLTYAASYCQLLPTPNSSGVILGAKTAGGVDRKLVWSNGALYPLNDNTVSCGAAGVRWTEVYAATATINTSDARSKQQDRPLSDAEKAVAVKAKALLKVFKFNDAVKKKGNAARIHFGVYAQELAEAFTSEGLDANHYAVFCYDEWQAEYDDDGNLIRKEGNAYGVRYEELLAFIISAL
jgi:hypothetical protein